MFGLRYKLLLIDPKVWKCQWSLSAWLAKPNVLLCWQLFSVLKSWLMAPGRDFTHHQGIPSWLSSPTVHRVLIIHHEWNSPNYQIVHAQQHSIVSWKWHGGEQDQASLESSGSGSQGSCSYCSTASTLTHTHHLWVSLLCSVIRRR